MIETLSGEVIRAELMELLELRNAKNSDVLIAVSTVSVDYVLAKPLLGKRNSMSFANSEGEQETEELTYNLACGLKKDLLKK